MGVDYVAVVFVAPILFGVGVPRGGGTLVLSCIRRLRPFFGVQNLEFQYFWVLFLEKRIFFGHLAFGCHHTIGLGLGVMYMHFRVF